MQHIEPIFTADLNNPADMELLKQFFSAEAINKALDDGGGGHQEILDNAALARLFQRLEAETPPAVREHNRQLQVRWDLEAAIERQTRDDAGPDIIASQLELFG